MVDLVVCPRCGSDELHGVRGAEGTIVVTCDRCGQRWSRVPVPSCPRCGAFDPIADERWGGESHDPVERREDTMVGSDELLRVAYRCRECLYTWRVEVSP